VIADAAAFMVGGLMLITLRHKLQPDLEVLAQ